MSAPHQPLTAEHLAPLIARILDDHGVAVQPAPGAAPSDPAAPADPFARLIDHTLLKPSATEKEILQLCAEARQHGFASVCVNPGWVPLCARELAGSSSLVCTVVGFPLGAMTPAAKAFEAREAVQAGAGEIDMVLNVGRLKSGDYRAVQQDVAAVVEGSCGRPVKVILETSLLTEEEKLIACVLSKAAGAAFVKTSTGFGGGGATVEDIALMRRVVGPTLGVKASGGVRDREFAEKLVAAGATRLGTSSGIALLAGRKVESGY